MIDENQKKKSSIKSKKLVKIDIPKRNKEIRAKKDETKTLLDLLKHPQYRKNCLISGVVYFVCVFDYYGSLFGIEALHGSIYFNSIFLNAADIFGCLLITITLERMSRKKAIYLSFLTITAMSAGFLIVNVPEQCIKDLNDLCWQKLFQAISVGVVKASVCVGFGVSYTYTTEVYSTAYRGIGVGTTVLIGRMGGILAPYMSNYLIYMGIYPQLSLGIVSLVACLFVIFGPETHGTGLDMSSNNFGSLSIHSVILASGN